jgi:hypothetical protein
MNPLFPLSLAVAAAAFLGHARADDITVDPQPFKSTRTRAEVQAELKAYRASGVDYWADNYGQTQQPGVGKSRAEVQAELKEYRASGIDPWTDDYSGALRPHS